MISVIFVLNKAQGHYRSIAVENLCYKLDSVWQKTLRIHQSKVMLQFENEGMSSLHVSK